MALPNTNISVAMVKSELGAATNDVGQLCTHPNVNKWSKYKPVRHSSIEPLTEAQKASMNYGLTMPLLSASSAKTSLATWDYARPRGGVNNEPYRLSDFSGYNHNAGAPLYFTINGNQVSKVMINTLFAPSLPSIVPVYKVIGKQSSGSHSDIELEGFGVSAMSISDIGNCLFAVTAQDNSGELLVANTEDTINCKYGTSINNNAIILSRSTMDTGFTVSDDEDFPEGATDKAKLTLYPRINLFQPASLGAVRKTFGGAPTSDTGLNGYYLSSPTPFLSTPLGGKIEILRYSWNPLKADYAYLSISNLSNGVPVGPSMWPFSDLNSGNPIMPFGGITMPIGVKILTVVTVTNEDAFTHPVYLDSFTFDNNRTTAVKMFLNSNPSEELTFLNISAGESVTLRIQADYTSYPSYTFPTIPSPGYGQIEAFANFKFSPSGNSGAARKSREQRLAWR